MPSEASFDWLVRRLPASRPLRVVDVGCGECLEGEILVANGGELVGIDLDEAAVAAAQARLPQATFICSDAVEFGETWSGPVDLLIARRPDLAAQPQRWRHALEGLVARLSPGALVLLTTPGPREAEQAGRWLEQFGLTAPELSLLPMEGEQYLVTARAPGEVPATETLPCARVMHWSEPEESDLVCDLTTGVCGF